MKCIKCGSLEDKVIDSRMNKDGTTIRRRRSCVTCDYRYTTYEHIERSELRVSKRNGIIEILHREKLLQGMLKACEKRPVSIDLLHNAVEEILNELQQDYVSEVPSNIIGLKVMNKLHSLDPVAYIRYVSVYRQFGNVKEFIQEIQTLERRNRKDKQQLKPSSDQK